MSGTEICNVRGEAFDRDGVERREVVDRPQLG